MTNSEKFKGVFHLYATELWAMPEEDFLNWINTEYKESESAQPEIIRCKDCRYSEYDFIFHSMYCHNKGKAELVGDNFFCAAGRYQTNGSDGDK